MKRLVEYALPGEECSSRHGDRSLDGREFSKPRTDRPPLGEAGTHPVRQIAENRLAPVVVKGLVVRPSYSFRVLSEAPARS